ncbi:MAG: TIGR04076 family protein [bacterium]|nr:TIGR04076 family protein [bacterium]
MSRIKVTVERIDGYCNLPVQVGNYFYVEDSKLVVPEGQPVCIWALQSMMPIFPILHARDQLDEAHWVRKVKTISCPDPKGLVQYRLELEESSPNGAPVSGPAPEDEAE